MYEYVYTYSFNRMTYCFQKQREMSKKITETVTIILLCYTLFKISAAVDTIRANEIIRDGDTITSAGGEFELGFFSPGSSKNRYLGIWYKKISYGTVVWVANRETPITNTLGMASVNDKGITVMLGNGSDHTIIWSSNTSISLKNPAARLLDTGNFVLWDEDHDINEDKENYVWQSFDSPVDNVLPGMKFGIDLVTGIDRYHTTWKSVDDPARGSFVHRLDPNGFPQFFWFKGSKRWARTGPWNGIQFSGNPSSNPNGIFTDKFVFNKKEIYYQFDLINRTSAVIRITTIPNGDLKLLVWNYEEQIWNVYMTLMVSDCDRYGKCGAYGICNMDSSPACECMRGFVPKFPDKWKAVDWSSGCVRKTKLKCGTGEGFVKYSGVKLPDTRNSWYDMTINLEECKRLCLKDCSCTAYANADIRMGGSGCILWFDDLIDIKGYSQAGQDIFVRMPASELGEGWGPKVKTQVRIILIPVVLILVLLVARFVYVLRKRKLNEEGNLMLSSEIVALKKTESEHLDLPLIGLNTITKATNNFSPEKMLGQGGFGPVYRGMLDDRQEIAAKRLSKNSSQGLDEFKNEVACSAKLQHRNLVTLFGCCTEKGERILIYEYMANKSLDSFIYDKETRHSLDWSRRYNIINGIAKGLLYLHEDSKLRIIHRDLKASNILLDHEMNPKISDFGIARSFRGSQSEAKTSRVVATYGYMSPEYAIDGQFSIKSDVYSFGVILIEIVSGMRNRSFSHPNHSLNLLGHAWMSYNEDNLFALIDGAISDSTNQINEVSRIIQIGLLCVQEDPKDRPVMSQVVQMLTSKMELPHPTRPGFFMERKLHESDHLLSNQDMSSSNQLTITTILPRR